MVINKQTKVHHLAITWRAMLIVPGVLFLLMAFIPLWLGNEATAVSDFWKSLLCFSPITGLVILYSFGCRLISSEDGLTSYYYFPFYQKIPWDHFERIEANPLGTVNLIYKTEGLKALRSKPSHQVITISAFIENWTENELLKDIHQYASQVKIPNEIYSRKNVSFRFRVGFLLVYFALCIPLMLLPLMLPDQLVGEIAPILMAGSFGLLGGILGGMMQLLNYSAWLNTKPRHEDLKAVSTILYLTPFSGWLMTVLLGSIYWMVINSFLSGLFNTLALLIGLLQFYILQYVFRIGMKT